jgi:hypothetical protein
MKTLRPRSILKLHHAHVMKSTVIMNSKNDQPEAEPTIKNAFNEYDEEFKKVS